MTTRESRLADVAVQDSAEAAKIHKATDDLVRLLRRHHPDKETGNPQQFDNSSKPA